MTTTETHLSEQVSRIPHATRPTVEAAIKAVKEAAPRAEEIPYRMQRPAAGSRMMWKIVRYALQGQNVVGIGTFPSHATLFFYRGRELDDESGLLQGSGQDSRFVTLRAPADVAQPAVKRLIRRAFKIVGGA